MTTIFHRFYENKNAFINPCDVTEPLPGFPEVCITTFSEIAIKDFVEKHTVNSVKQAFQVGKSTWRACFVLTDHWVSGSIRSPYTPSKVDLPLLTKQMDIYTGKNSKLY